MVIGGHGLHSGCGDIGGSWGFAGSRIPKGETWVDANGAIKKQVPMYPKGKTYFKLLKDKNKTDFSKTSTSRGVPFDPKVDNLTQGSKWSKAMDLFGELFSPK
ncbi:MAG: hypothetical protein IPJ13_27075 [Saprospiraceae bacterium]|nr:hypothetical protein [Saprospiraceae bacterium]